MSLNELYREVILDHYRSPRHHDHLDHPDVKAEGNNPLCGDEVTVEISFIGDTIADIAAVSAGCSISQASASMMTQALIHKDRKEVDELVHAFKAMMSIEESAGPEIDSERPGAVLGDLEALQGVRKFPVRVKCADLPWATLEQALAEDPGKSGESGDE